jgi:tetratricopeptide (TPR) repeat protein
VPAFFLRFFLVVLDFLILLNKLKKCLLPLSLLVLSICACHRETPLRKLPPAPDYKKALHFFETRKDSSFFYFNKVTAGSRDSLQVALAYNGMAELQSDAGDYFGSQENLSASLRFLNEHKVSDFSCLTADYNELGMTSLKLRHYDAAIGYYEKALLFTSDHEERATIYNNQANVYQEKHDYGRALTLYRAALDLVPPEGRTYARILTNRAFTQWLATPAYHAAPALLKALAIRRKLNDLWGQNGSYAHLSDYYMRSRPDSALGYAQQLYAVARRINSPNDQLDALQKLIRLGPVGETRRYFFAFKQLSDSIQAAHDVAKNQFALIRYDTERMKADNSAKELQLSKERTIRNSAFVLFAIITVASGYWYRKRKQLAVQANQLQFSTKVHNKLANGLYQLMQSVDNEQTLDKELVVQRLNLLYERSRDIAHEPVLAAEEEVSARISRLLNDFTGPAVNLAILGNEPACWENISPEVITELEQILQEWLVNMKKHSQATNVGIRFERAEKQLDIYYTDNGIGFSGTINYGKGLRDTENRIKAMGGKLNLANNPNKGATIHLELHV